MEKAKAFNNFFVSVFSKEDGSDIPNFSLQREVSILSDEIDLSPQNIEKHLSNLETFKSCGPDNVHARILLETKTEISKIFSIKKILTNRRQ